MKQPNVAVYGSHQCSVTTSTLKWLDTNHVPYEFKDLEASPELNHYVASMNNGKRVMPTIQIDNAILINPSEGELATAVQRAAAERP